MRKLTTDYYRRSDVIVVSRNLLGKVLCTDIDGEVTRAVICETEAYAGEEDKASHAYGGRRTTRTEPMYAAGGLAYIYLCYGIHHLFNVVVGDVDQPLAILVRAGNAIEGMDVMRRRRRLGDDSVLELTGPGVLTQALGITTAQTGTSLLSQSIWIEDHGLTVPDDEIVVGPRVGVDYAEEDAARPYRFRIAGKPSLGRASTSRRPRS